MIDEVAKRRPGFHQETSVPITLSDRGVWWFPKPWVQMRPCIKDGKFIRSVGRSTFGDEFDALMAAIASQEDPIQRLELCLHVVVFLLAHNYSLTDDELEELTTFSLGNEDDQRWLLEVLGVASGQGGKLSTAGGPSA